MKHQVLLLVIFCMVFSFILGGCEVEESFLLVRNHSNVTVVSLFISDTDDRSWGQDQLVFDVLRPGSMVTIAVEPGTYDIKVVSEYRQEFVYEATIVSGMTTSVIVR